MIGFAVIIYLAVGGICSAAWAPLWVTIMAWVTPWVALGIAATIDDVDQETAPFIAAVWPVALLVGLGVLIGDAIRKVFRLLS